MLDKQALQQAIERIKGGTPESNARIVRVLDANPSVALWIQRSMDKFDADPVAALGTLFQLGFEAGIEYHKLRQEGVHDDASTAGTAA